MIRPETDNETEHNAKRRKYDEEHDETLDLNEVQSADIFKLPIEIFERIFDYLSIEDLCAVAQMCKWMQKIAGRCYQQNYSGALPYFGCTGRTIWDKKFSLEIDYFAQFMHKIWIELSPINFRRFLGQQQTFHQLKKLQLSGLDLNLFQIDDMKDVLCKLEYLILCRCQMNEDIFERIVCFAPNMKRLNVNYCNTGTSWLDRKYPTLEHIEIVSQETSPIAKFLKLNPNIRKFGTNSNYLWANRQSLKAGKIKLDDLTMIIKEAPKLRLPRIIQLLNRLHQLEFYKNLKFDFTKTSFRLDQKAVDKMTKLNALVKLSTAHNKIPVALCGLKHLEEISFYNSSDVIDLKSFAVDLKNMTRIHFTNSSQDHLMLLIGEAAKLEKIRIWYFRDINTINMLALNRHRSKLQSAKKITLYVEENVYLATKRTNQDTNLELIQLKRAESYQWDRDFSILN